MRPMEAASGAGAYSSVIICKGLSVDRDVERTAVVTGQLRAPLHDEVVQHGGGTEAEPVRVEPLGAGDLVDEHQVAHRVLGAADAAGRLDRALLTGEAAPVPHRLKHDLGDGKRC